MHVSVTALGSSVDAPEACVEKIAKYLDGNASARGGRRPGTPHEVSTSVDGTSNYYADSVEGHGRWLGSGVAGIKRTGPVVLDDFRAVLLGRDPDTGAQLVNGSGSAERTTMNGRERETDVLALGDADELLSMRQAADLAGVSARYLRRLANRGDQLRKARAEAIADGHKIPYVPPSHLDAQRIDNAWRVTRSELARWMAARTARNVVVGFDVTFSAPKSVSILWATGSEQEQAEILTALDDAVAAGVSYLEREGLHVRIDQEPYVATGLLGAGWLHATSRALDPQLHVHFVVANMAEGPDGKVRTLDGRSLFAHQKTAGYLAGAELRHQLGLRLGVQHEPVVNGMADVSGVGREVIRAMSRRASEIDQATAAVGINTAEARQVAAYDTRSAKETGVDPAALRKEWGTRLQALGFDAATRAQCVGRERPQPLTERDQNVLIETLLGARGATEFDNVFSRQHVIRRLVELVNDRSSATEIEACADRFLTHPKLLRLHTDATLAGAQPNEVLYTTDAMVATEQYIETAYRNGLRGGGAVVRASSVEQAIAVRSTLGVDQAAMVRRITSSGHRVQCVVGPAGAGKSFAAEVAARALEADGYEPLGTAVSATAARVIGEAAAIPYDTVDALLTRLETSTQRVLTSDHVVIVDEASSLGNRHFARLLRHVQEADASIVLIGDPSQHTAVAAGGAWRYLVQRYKQNVPILTENRRQVGPEMSNVRLALADFRERRIQDAMTRLKSDDRVRVADTSDELFDMLVADWYVDRGQRLADPTRRHSSMTAVRHAERRELNVRARAMLKADGTLSGPPLVAGDLEWQVGDEVLSVAQDRELRPHGSSRRSFLRNGVRGTVVAVAVQEGLGQAAGLEVDFSSLGRIWIPKDALSAEVRPGVYGILAHSYAITTHKAQGETHQTARHLTSERSGAEGMYVGLSRGQTDLAVYVLREAHLVPDDDPGMPRIESDGDVLEDLTRRLHADDHERLATELDQGLTQVVEVGGRDDLRRLEELCRKGGGNALRRAAAARRAAIVLRACVDPTTEVVETLGDRPATGIERDYWERAAGAIALYRQRYPDDHRLIEDVMRNGPDVGEHELWATFVAGHEAFAALASGDHPQQLMAHRNQLVTKAGPQVVGLLGDVEAQWEQLRSTFNEWDGASEPSNAAQLAAAEARLREAWLDQPSGAVVTEIHRLDMAMRLQIDNAVTSPAPYLRRALGARSAQKDGATWVAAARAVETYRHEVLGVSPAEGAYNGNDPIVQAVGAVPSDPLSAQHWRSVSDAVHHVVGVEYNVGPQYDVG